MYRFVSCLLLAGFALHAEEAKKSYLPAGIPDLQGVWSNKWIVDMANGRFAEKTVEVPFTAWGKKLWDERTGNLQKEDPTLNCLPTGVPRQQGTPYPTQIVQTPDLAIILYEGAAHTYRIIPTDGRPHKKNAEELWMGDPVGHYEGNALVIDSIGFNDRTWLDSSGHPHSDKLHLTEKFIKVDAKNMRYEVTIDDPVAYTKPWTTTYLLTQEPGMEIMEYWCTENERDRVHMVGK